MIIMEKWIMYFEKSLIRRLHTLIQHEKEAPFRELYRQSLNQLERKYPEASPSARTSYPWQTHFRTQSQ
ncbi:hypothetical protein ACE3MZ_11515 [Paenibacillus sp. WLX1005]|uniref:hypothetical protein n=1 Tax=Paenibacillus sp. WLX1005 TaxID=3243766 RepID=UPI003984201D